MTSRQRVAVVVPRSFTLFELGVAIEVFVGTAPDADVREWYDVQVCTAEPGVLETRHGLFRAHVAHGVDVVDEADMVIVPEADSLDVPAHPAVLDAVRRADARGARLVSFCSGSFVLAAAGVLAGRTAATHWKYARRLAADYPDIYVDPDVLYVEDGHVFTSAGTAAGVDLSLHIVRKDHGASAARAIARGMVVPPHREGGQAQFVMSPVIGSREPGGGVHAALAYCLEHLHEDLTLADMAAVAHMSPRHFSRRFRDVTGATPSRWLLLQRLTRARELLEDTDQAVDRIARATGFGSPVTLRYHFAQSLQTTPTAYRRAFRHRSAARSAS